MRILSAFGGKSTEAHGYDGEILGVQGHELVGWAWNMQEPDQPLDIEILLPDGTKLAQARAGSFSQDLYLAGIGTGFHRFATPLVCNNAQAIARSQSIALTMRVAGTAITLGEEFQMDRDDLLGLVAGRRLCGKIEHLVDGRVEGWIADLEFNAVAPALRLSFDNEPLVANVAPRPAQSVMHQGKLINAWKFSAALPTSALDGRPHSVSAWVGDQEMEGSPLVVGPYAANDLIRAIGAQAKDIARLRDRIDVLPGCDNTEGLLDMLANRVLDRVDMLMSIYRDNVEQELGVMRNELVRMAGVVGHDQLDTVTAPVASARLPVTQAPIRIAFDETLEMAGGVIDLSVRDGVPVGTLRANIEVALPRPMSKAGAIMVEGVGANCTADLLQWEFVCEDACFFGRYEIWADGRWRFVGRIVGDQQVGERAGILLIRNTQAYLPKGGGESILSVARITLANGLVQPDYGDDLPVAVADHVAGLGDGFGWHGAELGARGAFRWLSYRAGVRVNLKGGYARKLTLVGEDRVPHDYSAKNSLIIHGGGRQLVATMEPAKEHHYMWYAEASVPEKIKGRDLLFELSAGEGVAKSPRDYAGSGDSRVLSYSIRAIAWDIVR